MLNAIIEAVKSYTFLTLNVFPFLFVGHKLMKRSTEEEGDLAEWLDAIGAGCICWGLMMSMFWIIMTLILLYNVIIEKPMTPDRIKEIIRLIQEERSMITMYLV